MRALALLACIAACSCSAVKPACTVINLANQVCTTLILEDGSRVQLSNLDTANRGAFKAAMDRHGAVGCR